MALYFFSNSSVSSPLPFTFLHKWSVNNDNTSWQMASSSSSTMALYFFSNSSSASSNPPANVLHEALLAPTTFLYATDRRLRSSTSKSSPFSLFIFTNFSTNLHISSYRSAVSATRTSSTNFLMSKSAIRASNDMLIQFEWMGLDGTGYRSKQMQSTNERMFQQLS